MIENMNLNLTSLSDEELMNYQGGGFFYDLGRFVGKILIAYEDAVALHGTPNMYGTLSVL